jgi:hypothetical protein
LLQTDVAESSQPATSLVTPVPRINHVALVVGCAPYNNRQPINVKGSNFDSHFEASILLHVLADYDFTNCTSVALSRVASAHLSPHFHFEVSSSPTRATYGLFVNSTNGWFPSVAFAYPSPVASEPPQPTVSAATQPPAAPPQPQQPNPLTLYLAIFSAITGTANLIFMAFMTWASHHRARAELILKQKEAELREREMQRKLEQMDLEIRKLRREIDGDSPRIILAT